MPFKSKAQQEHFQQLLKDGKITKEEFEKWLRGTPKQLPERVGSTKPPKIRVARIIR